MGFALSPSVTVTETDLTNVVPAIATTAGAFAGAFAWGPALEVKTISSEKELVETFGAPDNTTAISFFSAANFLAYGNNLQVVRVVGATAKNAVSTGTAVLITNEDDYMANYSTGQASVGVWAAKFAGVKGNSLKVSIVDADTFTTWDYASQFSVAPGTSDGAISVGGSNDELHIVVVDEDGVFTGTAGTILEKFAFVSKANDVKNNDGTSNYYKEVVNRGSKYVYWMDQPTAGTNWGTTATNKDFAMLVAAEEASLTGGVSDDAVTDADLTGGFDMFSNDEKYDVSLIVSGLASQTVQDMLTGLVETRRDCVVFLSPSLNAVVSNVGSEASTIITERNALTSSSYAVMDSGWKYQYDRYNDTYRWIPLNGDIAGLCARSDNLTDPWYSPAGYTRGQIKNVVKLAWTPNRTDRDNLYKSGVNPVVSFPGQGTLLFGDKTMLAKPSAFDRINVRRLFIVLEKSIATAAKYQLFEFNDVFSRAQFRNLVEPFLRDVQGRRGVTGFQVVCDETNNTEQVIATNEFVGDIYIRPNYSTNFIKLNFIATKSGAAFSVTGA